MSLATRSNEPAASPLLRQLIEDPLLTNTVQALPAAALTRLINHVGLEDAGEIIAVASDTQLLEVLDADAWVREKGGHDEEFDPERFLFWLEILLEAGEKALVERLQALPEELVISAFYSHILVLNLDDLSEKEAAWSEDDVNLADKALMDCLGHELDEFYIVARQDRGWDTVLTSILALYDHDPSLLNRILEKCCYASWEYIEENGGLYEVLSAEEMLASDAAADRADRRAKQGYVAPSDATAFIKLAANRDVEQTLRDPAPDPITRAYFRELDAPTTARPGRVASGAEKPAAVSGRVLSLLKQTGILPETEDTALLPGASTVSTQEDRTRYHALMRELSESDPDGHEHRVRQIIYLTNIIEAAFGNSASPIRPVEAVKTVFQILDAGLAYLPTLQASKSPEDGTDLSPDKLSPIALFFVGFKHVSDGQELRSTAELQEALARTVPQSVRL